MTWMTIERPGYLGKKRDELTAKWNAEHPQGWRIVWQWGSKILERPEAFQVYEDAYYEFLKSNPDKLEWLINTASNVYDTSPTNVQAGLSYEVQETRNNHIHDVAIRRSVMRLGKEFHGTELIEVRSTNAKSWILSPCMVPFHLPSMIIPGEIKDYGNKGKWWIEKGIKDSVEEYYQQNKILQIRK